jgi:hypothetical protein
MLGAVCSTVLLQTVSFAAAKHKRRAIGTEH